MPGNMCALAARGEDRIAKRAAERAEGEGFERAAVVAVQPQAWSSLQAPPVMPVQPPPR